MLLMIIVVLAVAGLCLGSFVNALVWRLHEQVQEFERKTPRQKYLQRLSISRGRSMCPHCKHELAASDLIPVVSWLSLRGKCRYCAQPISIQYPVVEVLTAVAFLASYVWWPTVLSGLDIAVFGLWLALLTGLMALLVYDLRWYLLPNRVIYPLAAIAAVQAAVRAAAAERPLVALLNTALAVIVGGGIFYVLFQISKGKWIGGGDVKLGWVIGLALGTPGGSFLFIFIASLLGSLVSIPLLASKRLKRDSLIPFGPFLIAAAVVVQLFGDRILHWYGHVVLMLY